MRRIIISLVLLIVLSMAFADENDTPAGATLVNVPVNGSQYEIDNEDDIDWYKFQINQPGNLHIYLTRPSGDLDPAIWIYGPHNSSGVDVIPSEPVSYDDDGHGNLLPEINIYAPNPGYYFLRVSSYEDYPYDDKSGFRGIGSYALHITWDGDVGNLIYPTELEFMSSGGTQFVQVSSNGAWTISENVTWLACDPVSGHGNAYFNLIVDPNVGSPRYTNITITFDDGEPASANLYVFQNQPNFEDNNTPQSATQLSLPVNGNLYQIESEDDIDWYRFHLEQEDIYRFWLTRPSGDLDPTFWLYGPSDEFGSTFIPNDYIASDDDSYGDMLPYLEYSVVEPGYYFLRVTSYEEWPGDKRRSVGSYRLYACSSTSLEDELAPANGIRLSCYPNPFNPSTTICYELTEPAEVIVNIYDLRGRRVRSLVNGQQGTGQHSLIWDGKDDNNHAQSSGVYFIRISTSGICRTRKVALMK